MVQRRDPFGLLEGYVVLFGGFIARVIELRCLRGNPFRDAHDRIRAQRTGRFAPLCEGQRKHSTDMTWLLRYLRRPILRPSKLEKNGVSFLLKVVVVRQCLSNAMTLHRVHGNTVLQAVFLIVSCSKQSKSIRE